jgi:diaminopimelate decarboxylase
MNCFQYRSGRLFAEDVDLSGLADQAGTPLYVYSTAALEQNYRAIAEAFPPNTLIAYAVKSNGNLAVLKTLGRLGAGADVVSGGELKKALAAGIPAARIVFSGVGKTRPEMRLGLQSGIRQFNVESEPELEALNGVALELNTRARIAVRINPDVDARTHAKIATGTAETKFGVPWNRARDVYARAASLAGIDVVGVDVHIGSQVMELAPFQEAFRRIAELIVRLRADGHAIVSADLGGGLGVPYTPDVAPPDPRVYAEIASRAMHGLGVAIVIEPGRFISGNAGILLARVIYVKQGVSRRFLVIDAGMNDLLRPALYDAYHDIVPVAESGAGAPIAAYDVVGPICETADLFGRDRRLPEMKSNDLVAIMTAGAYGAVMSSAYNVRPPAAEVIVKDRVWSIVRPRISDDELLGLDVLPPWLAG